MLIFALGKSKTVLRALCENGLLIANGEMQLQRQSMCVLQDG